VPRDGIKRIEATAGGDRLLLNLAPANAVGRCKGEQSAGSWPDRAIRDRFVSLRRRRVWIRVAEGRERRGLRALPDDVVLSGPFEFDQPEVRTPECHAVVAFGVTGDLG